jgi:hypothetical protein
MYSHRNTNPRTLNINITGYVEEDLGHGQYAIRRERNVRVYAHESAMKRIKDMTELERLIWGLK